MFDAQLASQDNDASSIVPAAEGGTWRLVTSGPVSAAVFGNLADDVGAAVLLAQESGYHRLLLPDGEWQQRTPIVVRQPLTLTSSASRTTFGVTAARIVKHGDFPHVDAHVQFNSLGIEYEGNRTNLRADAGSADLVLRVRGEFYGVIQRQPGNGIELLVQSEAHNLNGMVLAGASNNNGGNGLLVADSNSPWSPDTNNIYSPYFKTKGNDKHGVVFQTGLYPRFYFLQADTNGGHGLFSLCSGPVKASFFSVYAEGNSSPINVAASCGGAFSDNVFVSSGPNVHSRDLRPHDGNLLILGRLGNTGIWPR